MKKTFALGLLTLASSASLHAALVYNNNSSTSEGTFVASNTDLAQTQLTSIARTSGSVFAGINGGNPNQLVNGSALTGGGLFHSSGTNDTHFPATYTLEFDLSINTLGYDITTINTIAGWNENGRTLANQQYELQYSVVGDAAFQSLGVQSFTPFSGADGNGASASLLSITDDSGTIAQGVDAIRFIVQDHGQHTGTAQGTVFKEFDVIGAATVASVPEPSTTALIGIGGLSLILRRRR
ncbi:PEP-CTERM sorting domain-containing protein [Rubritalea tangerina]|uniref:PEP-CTERM sorting domain-containing protein n=1 Tax=Rubritalea tangerina TaxID=430798 RepID=A0ABW4ZEK7_9BACT